jgi:hypothetical protein
MRIQFWAGPLLQFAVLVTILNPVRGQPIEPPQATTNVIEQFDIGPHGDGLFVPVDCHGKRYLFLVDTGASNTIFDSSFRSLLGDPVVVRDVATAGSAMRIPGFKCPPVAIGTLPLQDAVDVVLQFDLTRFRQASGKNIYGILGMDFLQNHIVNINADTKKLSLLRSVDKNRAGVPLRITFEQGLPHVAATIPGWGLEHFLIDTGMVGFTGCDLERSLFDYLFRHGELQPFGEGLSEVASGSITYRMGRLRSFSLANFQHEKLCADESRRSRLCLSYWLRYTTTFDFPNQRLYLAKSGGFDKEDRTDLSGIHFLRRDGQVVIDRIDKGSPGDVSGLKPDDVIVSLGGMRGEGADLWTLRSLLCREGDVPMVLLRAGRILNLTIVPDEEWRRGAPREEATRGR